MHVYIYVRIWACSNVRLVVGHHLAHCLIFECDIFVFSQEWT